MSSLFEETFLKIRMVEFAPVSNMSHATQCFAFSAFATPGQRRNPTEPALPTLKLDRTHHV